MASKIIIAIPADTYLHANEGRTDLLGLSHLNLGQLGLLFVHFIPHHLRMHSHPLCLGFTLRRSLHQQKPGTGHFRWGQRVLRSFEFTTPHLGNVALANGTKKESWHHCGFCDRCSVSASLYPIPLSDLSRSRQITKTDSLHQLVPLSQVSAGFFTPYASRLAPTSPL